MKLAHYIQTVQTLDEMLLLFYPSRTFSAKNICMSAFSVKILDLSGLVVSLAFEENTLSVSVFVLPVRGAAYFSVKIVTAR